MLALQIVLLLVGFVLLVKGADWFVDGSAGVAEKCKIPTLVIGLTVVAFGTSAPELAVSVTSAIKQSTDIAIGNVVGSNIVNVLLILGLSALLHTLPVQKSSLILDLPVLLLASALLVGLGVWGNSVTWWDGLILLAVFAVYMFILLRGARKEIKAAAALEKQVPAGQIEETEQKEEPKGKFARWYAAMKEKTWFLVVLVVIGLSMVVGGGTLLVDAAKYIATYFGVSERIIGLTVVAIGTSLPELVTSVIAAIKGETDIAVGNIIGSNIFNIFLVAGVSSLFYPLAFTSGNLVDACVALGAAVLLLVLSLFKGHKLGKISGGIMVASFIGYYVYLFLV
ncbi:MAG: calcium/sodium antiporter [Clostridia bacterium]|nr:calcium/sodium antiporter [Clostridia bacterium]